MRTKALSREERKQQIVLLFAMRIQNGNFEYGTAYDIARVLEITAGGKFYALLREMEGEEILISRPINKPGKWTGREYMLFPGTYQTPKARVIPLKLNGKNQGQLELF